jgi:hypothetical protein
MSRSGFELFTPPGTHKDCFTNYHDGAYFSLRLPDAFLHGDAWALSSFLFGARPDLASHEVLYVGQAFGRDGSRGVAERLRRHETLQRIYEDHTGSDSDIFVAPIRIKLLDFHSDDHIDDNEDGPELFKFLGVFIGMDHKVLKPSVDLAEHALIASFLPPYNRMLRTWDPLNPTEAMRRMREARFRLLHYYLDGWGGLVRFYSGSRPSAARSHFFSRSIVPSAYENDRFEFVASRRVATGERAGTSRSDRRKVSADTQGVR